MSIEIERRFLIRKEALSSLDLNQYASSEISQGYIARDQNLTTCRVRISGDAAWLTIKGKAEGAARPEFEFPIDVATAGDLLARLSTGIVLSKTRYIIPYQNFTWELDIFHGENEGLIIAEVELPDISTSPPLPHWIGTEITSVTRYYNSELSRIPFSKW